MVISRTAVHGIYAICYLSRQRPTDVSSSATVAAALGIGRAHAAKVLKRLAAARVVSSVRGRRGGYALIRKMNEILVVEVLDALNPLRNQNHLRAEACTGDRTGMCNAHRGLLRLEDRMRSALADETLQEMEGSVCIDDGIIGNRSDCHSKGICEALAVL